MAFRRPDLPLRWAACAVAILGIGCGREPVVGVVSAGVSPADGLECSIPTSQIFAGGPGKDGIPAFLFGELLEAGPVAAVSGFYAGVPIVVFWDSSVASVPHSSFGRSVVIRPL